MTESVVTVNLEIGHPTVEEARRLDRESPIDQLPIRKTITSACANGCLLQLRAPFLAFGLDLRILRTLLGHGLRGRK